MNYCLITFRSVTPAQRGEGVLRRAGYECSLRRTPKWMEEQGCGYSIQLQQGDCAEATALLRRGKIPFRKVYLWHNGTAEEWML